MRRLALPLATKSVKNGGCNVALDPSVKKFPLVLTTTSFNIDVCINFKCESVVNYVKASEGNDIIAY